MPTTEINDLAPYSGCGGGRRPQRGDAISFSGSRSAGTVYIIDGIAVQIAEPKPVIEYIAVCHPKCQVVTYDYYFKLGTLSEAISVCPGIYQARRGDDISIFGSRTSGVKYIVDGMWVN